MASNRTSTEEPKAEIAARYAEIAALTRLVEDLEEKLVQSAAQHDELVRMIEYLKQDQEQACHARAMLEEENRRLKAHVQDLLASTSWRMTGPLRRFALVWRKRKRP